MGIANASSVNFSVNRIFNPAKLPFRFFESYSYLTGVTAAELERYLSIIYVIFPIFNVCLTTLNISENNGTVEIGFVTTTPKLVTSGSSWYHYSDVTWASTYLIFQQFIEAEIKRSIKYWHHWPFNWESTAHGPYEGNNQWPVDSPNKRASNTEKFPCQDVIMVQRIGPAWRQIRHTSICWSRKNIH